MNPIPLLAVQGKMNDVAKRWPDSASLAALVGAAAVAVLALCAACKEGTAVAPPLSSNAPSPALAAPSAGAVEPASTVTCSPEEANRQIARLDTSEECALKKVRPCGGPEYRILLSFGASAMPELLAAVEDGKHGHVAPLLFDLIAAAKAPGMGPRLVERGNSHPPDAALGFYQTAGRIGGRPVFDALIAAFSSAMAAPDVQREEAIRHGLNFFPKETVAWAFTELPKARRPIAIADLIAFIDIARADNGEKPNAGDLAERVRLVAATNDPLAKQHLATSALDHGATDDALFTVFIVGVASKNADVRMDARSSLRRHATKLPSGRKPEVLAVLSKGIASKELTLDEELGETLVIVGSTDERVFEVLFRGLASPDLRPRLKAARALAEYADKIPAAMRPKIVTTIKKALADPQNAKYTIKRNLEQALKALGG